MWYAIGEILLKQSQSIVKCIHFANSEEFWIRETRLYLLFQKVQSGGDGGYHDGNGADNNNEVDIGDNAGVGSDANKNKGH